MGVPPVQYFRKEDFPELAGEGWAQRFFTKLNELARQTQYNIDKNISVSQNLSGFWWEGTIGAFEKAQGIVYPYSYAQGIPNITPRQSVNIQAFPFSIPNQIVPKLIKGVFVAQAFDVTQNSLSYMPALVGAVAWRQEADTVKIYGIDGMVTGTSLDPAPGRCYFTRLLLLSE